MCVCVCVCVECRSQHPDENSEVITGVVSGLTTATLSLGSAIKTLSPCCVCMRVPYIILLSFLHVRVNC